MTTPDPGLLDEAAETTTHTEPIGWTVGDRVVWPHREGHGRRRHDVYSYGTVIAVDLPGLPAGVQVRLDEAVRGCDTVYASHRELLRAETTNHTEPTHCRCGAELCDVCGNCDRCDGHLLV